MRERSGGAGAVLLEVLAARRTAAERELMRRVEAEREEAERVMAAERHEQQLDSEGRALESGRMAEVEADVDRYRARRDGLRLVRAEVRDRVDEAKQRRSLAGVRVDRSKAALAELAGRERALSRWLARGMSGREDDDA